MDQTPNVALLPSPGMGHLIPFVEFAKQLVNHHHFSATILITAAGPPTKAQKTVLKTLPETIKHIFLPPVSLPKDLNIGSQIILTMTLSLPSLRDTLASLKMTNRLVSLIVDPFGLDIFNIAKEFSISQYLFFTSPAMALQFCLHLPKLDDMITCEYRDLPEAIRLPGCVPVYGRDLTDSVQDRSNDAYKGFLGNVKRFGSAEGIILNSFMDLEEGAIKALQEKEPGKPPVYLIGPLIQTDSSDESQERPECLQWLDDQPSGSVLFVSFGSGGTLSHHQLSELALGLELSSERFLWVVRSPNDKSANAAFFTAQSQNDPFSFLPKGFLERTKGRGLVVPSWAPQIEVLRHHSTRGFLTHCGWNSILESVVHGVPLIAWPLYAEQKMNAVMLTEGLNVALRPKSDETGLVRREEIANVVKSLMEGEEGNKVCRRMEGLKDAAAKVHSEDGNSTKSLSELAFKWKNQKNI
ncbi:Hydroquinone glucosyltransferase [Camellia lanceoleosa]|uniref:Hydroquinone glucosyltransferase n=1 Tax=Camellia lanceoleosa TaxID=1840588 RepID=A0ACC0IRE1_9ERIC|nr:Hydroquinone glucosyltransferase [Camellia lanceoleosa]